MRIIWSLVVVLIFSINFAMAQDTLYIYRAGIVVNKKAVAEIDSVTFYKNYALPGQEVVTDIDGNAYHTVKIGTQTWMIENLRTTKYRNGENINNLKVAADWKNSITGSWCNYNNDSISGTNYGKLYNWYAVSDSRNIAPVGWHVASDAEWTTLTTYLGESAAGGKLKETGFQNWFSPNTGATNESGFTGLPGGLRSYSDGTFRNLGSNGYFWSSTQSDSLRAWDRELFYNQVNCFRYYYDSKRYGFSVRCVKDETLNLPTVSTGTVSAISDSTALSGGNITNDGGAQVTARGVCWSTSTYPSITTSKTTDVSGTGVFTSTLSGLTADSTYYVRAYATNSVGTAYGEQISFKTLKATTQTVTDIDGNVYKTIKIGNQTWMAENLKTTRFNDSIAIPLVSDNYQWISLTTPGYRIIRSYKG